MFEFETEGQEGQDDEQEPGGESGGASEESGGGSQGWDETSDEPHQGEQGQDAV